MLAGPDWQPPAFPARDCITEERKAEYTAIQLSLGRIRLPGSNLGAIGPDSEPENDASESESSASDDSDELANWEQAESRDGKRAADAARGGSVLNMLASASLKSTSS